MYFGICFIGVMIREREKEINDSNCCLIRFWIILRAVVHIRVVRWRQIKSGKKTLRN